MVVVTKRKKDRRTSSSQGFSEPMKKFDASVDKANNRTKSQFPTIDTSNETAEQRQKRIDAGVFVNETTGETKDRYGKNVEYDPLKNTYSEYEETTESPERPLEQRAEDLVADKYRKDFEAGEEFEKDFGIENPFEDTLDAELRLYKEEQKKQEEYLKKQNKIAEEVQQGELSDFRRGTESGIEAVKARLSQGREGVVSSGRSEVVSQYETIARQRVDRAIKRVNSARMARQNAEEALKKAQKEGDKALIRQYSGAVEAAKLDIMNAEAEIMNAESDNRTEARLLTDSVLSTFESMGPQMANLRTQDIMGMIEGTNITLPAALAIKEVQRLEGEAAQTKDEVEQEKLLLETEKIRKEIDNIGIETPTAAIKNYNALQMLIDSGASKEAINNFKLLSGIGMTEKDRAQMIKIQAETKGIQLKNSRIISGGASNGAGRENPIQYFTEYNFGEGQRGDNITSINGEIIGRISSPYGANHSQISGEKNHNGIDVVFNGGQVRSLSGGTIVKKGYAEKTYGGYVWIQGKDDTVMQYGHLSVDDVRGLTVGEFVENGQVFARHEANEALWGSSSGAHTDIRFVGVEDGSDQYSQTVKDYGYAVLDGRMKISNIVGLDQMETAMLRQQVTQFTNEKLNEGYKSNYPVLTETQLQLVDQISDDVNKAKPYANMLDVKNGFESIKVVYDDLENATGFQDISAINAFQRMIDPGATVREGDVELLQSAIPFFQRVSPSFNWQRFKTGDKLPPGVRESLLETAAELYNEKARIYNETTGNQFRERAREANVPENLIMQDFPVYDESVGSGYEQEYRSFLDDTMAGLDTEAEAEIDAIFGTTNPF